MEGLPGTAGFVMNIIKKAEEIGLVPRWDLNLKVALVSGEVSGEPMRKLFKEKYGMITGDFFWNRKHWNDCF